MSGTVPRVNVSGTIYLLHFDKLFYHCRHYIGWTERSVEERYTEHVNGNGSRLVRAACAAGVKVEVVRTWPGTRELERAFKRRKNAPRLCPVCLKGNTHE